MTGSPAHDRKLTVVDLFAGAGGLSEGARASGLDVIMGTDHDPDACATYAANFPDAETINGDIRSPEIREQVRSAAAGADIVVGGPPCQAFSQMRNYSRLIDDPRNSLYREFVRTVADASPLAFIMENVPGLLQMGVKDQVIADLSIDGEYEVRAQLVDAADFGVPQTRKRVIFVGVKRSLGIPTPEIVGLGAVDNLYLARFAGRSTNVEAAVRYEVVARFSSRGDLLDRLADPGDDGLVTAAQAISDLAWLEPGRRNDGLDAGELPPAQSAYQKKLRAGRYGKLQNVSVPRVRQDTVLRLEGIPAGGNHRDLDESLQKRYLTGAKWGPHNGSGKLARAHFYAYRRLHPDIWAWTLNTKADSVYHYAASRALSVREFARMQSFPDRFTVATDSRRGPLPGRIDGGGAHSRYRQIGNAVPPLLAYAVASRVRAAVLGFNTDKIAG